MEISTGDYVVLDLAKAQLAKVVRAEKPFKAVLERDREAESSKVVPVEFKLSDVLANLGKSPRAGTVHGVKIEPLHRTDSSKFFASIRIYQDMSEERYKAFRQEMISFIKTIKAKGLAGPSVELEVRPVSGKYSGYYKFHRTGDTDILCVRPNESLDGMSYIFAHEWGHAIHNRMMPKHIWLKWIKSYHDHVSVTSIDDAELISLREEIEAVRSLGEYLKDCTEDVKPIVKAILKYVSQVQGLSKHHLELMLASDESLEEIWPTALDLSNKDMVISEYAEKSPEEFFAECFAFHFLGRKLPKNLAALMEVTLRSLVKPGGN